MKPAPFEYRRPESMAELLQGLARDGPDAALLAGGQSLLARMNARTLAPRVVYDINGLSTGPSVIDTPG